MEYFKNLYTTQLLQLSSEISSYKKEENIWKEVNEISNCPGNLCLHICGNLKYFIGSVIGNTGYVRDRDREFSEKSLNRDELIKEVDDTVKMIENFFGKFSSRSLNQIYPLDKFGKNAEVSFIFARLVSHLSYHLGQINYHRRITDSE